MKIKEVSQNKNSRNGFIVFLLDFLFVAVGIGILVISLLRDRGVLASIFESISRR